MTPAFSLPKNPRLNDEERDSFICSQEPRFEDKYNDPIDCVDCEFKDDMHWAAANLFENINFLRTDISPCSAIEFHEIWAD